MRTSNVIFIKKIPGRAVQPEERAGRAAPRCAGGRENEMDRKRSDLEEGLR